MSVYRRMLGRELPCTLRLLLGIEARKLSARQEEALERRASLGAIDAAGLYRLGMSAIAHERWGAAMGCFSGALEIDSSHVASRIALAVAHEGMGQHELAGAQLDSLLKSDGVDIDTLLCAAGLAWERAGKTRSAMNRYEDALIKRPGNRFAANRLVALHLAGGQITAAALRLSRSLDHRPADLAARICLGHVLQLSGRYAEAAGEYEKALRIEPEAALPAMEGAEALGLVESGGAAIGLLKKLISARPRCPDLCLKLAEIYSEAGDDRQARNQYEKALEIHPEYIECRISFARHELRMGRRQESARQFRRALAIHELHIELYVGLALSLQQLGQSAQAYEILRSAARLSRNAALLISQLRKLHEVTPVEGSTALLQVPEQWVMEQIEDDELTLLRHPRWNDVRVRLAAMMRLMGKMQESMELLRRAVLTDTSSSDAWLALGLNFVDGEAFDRAILAFQSGMVMDAKQMAAEYRLGLIYCGELEFDLSMEAAGCLDEDMARQVWVALDAMGLCEEAEGVAVASAVAATVGARA